VAERRLRVDFCPTRTDQWRTTLPVQRRTGFGHFRTIDVVAQIVDNLLIRSKTSEKFSSLTFV
jgi:hypothetical protein